MLRLHSDEIQNIISPIQTTIADLMGARQKSQLLDGFMPGATSGTTIRFYREQVTNITNNLRGLAITITYKPGYQENEEEVMKKILISNLAWIHNNQNIDFKVALIPDQDINGNFHYHGSIIIKRKDIRKFKKYITMFNGYMKFRYITETELWEKYIWKSYTGQHKKQQEPIYEKEDIEQLSLVYDCL